MAKRMSVARELWLFVKTRKAYVLAPIIAVLILLIGLIILGGTSAAPFIYPLF